MKQQHFWFIGDSNIDWRLDEHTKDLGRAGIAQARATLDALNSHGDGHSLSQAA